MGEKVSQELFLDFIEEVYLEELWDYNFERWCGVGYWKIK